MSSHSSSSNDSDSSHTTPTDDEGDVNLTQAPAIWTSAQAKVLNPFKERWFSAERGERPAILEEALEKLVDVTPDGRNDNLKTKVVKWLNRTSRRRKKYGPGSLPSLRSVLYWYKGDEFSKLADELYPMKTINPGQKPSTRPNVAGLSKAVSDYMKELKSNPAKAEEWDKYEALRVEWAKSGAPKAKREMKASRQGAKMISKFAMKLYWETGMRIVVLAGHKNGNNKVVHGIFDHNTVLGKQAKNSFAATYPELSTHVQPAFVKYCRDNATDDEGAVQNESDTEDDEGLDLRKGFRQKPRLELEKNKYGEPQLPKDCLRTAGDKNKDLDRKKDILRTWLTGYYNIAKGSKMVRVPWKRIADEPEEFYDAGFLPPGIQIRDPSKMVKEQIEACFRFWQKKERKERQPFQFRQVYSSQKGYQPGRGRRIPESDSDSDSEGNNTRRRYEHAKEPSPCTSDDSDEDDIRIRQRQHQTKKARIRKARQEGEPSCAEDENNDSRGGEDVGNGQITKDKGKGKAKNKMGGKKRLKRPLHGKKQKVMGKEDAAGRVGSGAGQETSGTQKRPSKRNEKSAPPDSEDDEADAHDGSQEDRIDPDIDPTLQLQSRMYGTHGPNDEVPLGCIAVPFINFTGAQGARTRSQTQGQYGGGTAEPSDERDGEMNITKKRKRPAPIGKPGLKAKADKSEQSTENDQPKAKKSRVVKMNEPVKQPPKPRPVTRRTAREASKDSFNLSSRRKLR